MGTVKQPRAPRRHQVEVDDARHKANETKAELRAVRAELQRVRRDVRAVVREWRDYPASYPRQAFADDVLDAIRSRES